MTMRLNAPAPGGPGISARWTSSAKSGVGTALGYQSRVWFTISHGILNEIYFPRIDYACTRDCGFIVTDGNSFFSEEKRDTRSAIRAIAPGVPGFTLTNTCNEGRYEIEKTVIADPHSDVILQKVRFRALAGSVADYRVYVLLAPHLVNRGASNTAWVDEYKGRPMLAAEGMGAAIALGCSTSLRARSVGFVGVSDGWQDLTRHYRLTELYDHAIDGNVALTGEIDLSAAAAGAKSYDFVVALGFGRIFEEAGYRVAASLNGGFDRAASDYAAGWSAWQAGLRRLDRGGAGSDQIESYRVSTAVLRTHEAQSFPGGLIASLSIPWGFNKSDDDLGGYHLVWPRDLVETAGGLVAAGAIADARRVLDYLCTIQEPDGRWPQNCWLDGTVYWGGVQLDECAFPILLVDMLARENAFAAGEIADYWPMVRKAAGFVVANGPETGQDRWEEDAGYSTFTLAVEIAALLCAADIAESLGHTAEARYLRETADCWNGNVEAWTLARDTPLSRELGISGYYVRISPADGGGASPVDGTVEIRNRPGDDKMHAASSVVSPDALGLVRFGLRAADDPRILDTVRAIDALLRVEFDAGPSWRRYNHDGYGEKADGSPFDGVGIGRAWPLMTGERAHYALAAGNKAEAEHLLNALEAFSSDGKLLPEQVWDADDIPERELVRGRPSGSAMPLVWAHSEHIKLLRSLADGKVFDMPRQTVQRYLVDKITSNIAIWRFSRRIPSIPSGMSLRIEVAQAAMIHWSSNGWAGTRDQETAPSGLGLHYLDLETNGLSSGAEIVFTFRWTDGQRWEGEDFSVRVT